MLIGIPSAAKKPAAATAAIYDVTTAEFETAVIAASLERPVIVDFWAPWCGPCKQLGPLLEQAVSSTNGAVALAKVDIDQNPELAQAFRVQSIPMVVAMYQGKPVTAFAGAKPKAEIDHLVEQLVQLANQTKPQALDIGKTLTEAAALLSAEDIAGAQTLYLAVLAQDEQNAPAYTGLVRVLIASGELEQAEAMLADVPDLIVKDPALNGARAALELARAAPADDLPVLAAKVQATPDDPALRYDYAEACCARGRKEEAATLLLELIRTHRSWEDDKARKQLLRYFEAWGPVDPATVAARRKLSAALFS